jgi:Zn finger protein HypA/HybF involved in hydrogenase expression
VIIKKTYKKKSKVWTLDKNELQEVVKKSNSIAEVLRYYGYGATGATHQIFKKRLIADCIDFSHMKMGYKSNIGRKFNFRMTEEEAKMHLFIEFNDKASTKQLKSYLLLFSLKKYECAECSNTGLWQDKKLSLQLDHINGDRYDNRLENLRFLCPNCHSQTNTFGSKNHK